MTTGPAEKPPRSCFVVSPIGNSASPERKHANIVLKFIIRPVLAALGFGEPVRADTLSEPGLISRQIVSHLLNADLVIADLTGRNPNVFYELAIRHATGKPFVQMITKGEVIPFDVGHQRTIQFDRTDLDDVEDAKEELRRQVEATMAEGFRVETPIGHALDFEALKRGGTAEQALSLVIDRLDRLDGIVRANAAKGGGVGAAPAHNDLRALAAGDPDLLAIHEIVYGWCYTEKAPHEFYEQWTTKFWKQFIEFRARRPVTLSVLRAAVTKALDEGARDLAPYLASGFEGE